MAPCTCLDGLYGGIGVKVECEYIEVSYQCYCAGAAGHPNATECQLTGSGGCVDPPCTDPNKGTSTCACGRRMCGRCTGVQSNGQCIADGGKGCYKSYFTDIGAWVMCTDVNVVTRGYRCCPKQACTTGSCSAPGKQCSCKDTRCGADDCPSGFPTGFGFDLDCTKYTAWKDMRAGGNDPYYECVGVRWRHCCGGCLKAGGYLAYGCHEVGHGEMCARHCGNTLSACDTADMCDCGWLAPCDSDCVKCTNFNTAKRCPDTVTCESWPLDE